MKVAGLLLVGTLAAGVALAQQSPQDKAESERRMNFNMSQNFLVHDFQVQTMEACGNVVAKTSYRQLPWNLQEPAVEQVGETTVSVISWTGGCVDGKRDGLGVIEWTVQRSGPPNSQVRYKAEGPFVKGKQIGLWCFLDMESTVAGKTRKIDSTGCYLVTGEPLRGPLSFYRKQADGRWQLWGYNGPASPAVYLPAGSMEAESGKMIAAAMSGKAPAVATLTMQSQALNDLVRGAKIAFVPVEGAVPLKDKRIAVVLSSSTVDEMERFERDRAAFIAATSGVTGDAAKLRAQFIEASNPDRLMTNLIKMLRTVAKDVQRAEDLSVLGKGGADYVLVIDWKSLTRFDLLGKYSAFPVTSNEDWGIPGKTIVVGGQSLGAFLIAPGLKAIKQYPGSDTVMGKQKEIGWKGDTAYLGTLAAFYSGYWGKGPDDLGSGLRQLEFLLRR